MSFEVVTHSLTPGRVNIDVELNRIAFRGCRLLLGRAVGVDSRFVGGWAGFLANGLGWRQVAFLMAAWRDVCDERFGEKACAFEFLRHAGVIHSNVLASKIKRHTSFSQMVLSL